MPVADNYTPEILHAGLGSEFYDIVEAAPFPRHILRFRNNRAARSIGLDQLSDAEWLAHFGQFKPLPRNMPEPLALRYHGHQFRSYNPHLGDGRGFLFAQMREAGSGRLLDLGTKGSGKTPWSRGGDGRLTLKGAVREVLAAELLEAHGVSTSRAFSVVETGERLMRNDEPSPTRSAVLVRLNHSNIRIGTFQRLAYLGENHAIERLIDYAVEHYFPHLVDAKGAERVVELTAAISRAVSVTGARWLAAGFVHGVLNTDNINITGESFDYGPWRFLSALDPNFTAAYFDQTGLYAFGRQPGALKWNLAQFAGTLLPFASEQQLATAIDAFDGELQREFRASMVRRLGLAAAGPEEDRALSHAVWNFLAQSQTTFEQFFFDWAGGPLSRERALAGPAKGFYAGEVFAPVLTALEAREPSGTFDLAHPYFALGSPCTLLVDEVEALWAPIASHDDWSLFHRKLAEIDQFAIATGNRPHMKPDT